MARLVLHIGTHKTGTTTVQNALHANREALAAHGVLYPDLSPHTGHHGFLTDWIALPAAYRKLGGGKAGLARIADELRGTDTCLLLSSEEMSRAGGAGGRVDYRELRGIFDGFDILVLCVVREQGQFLQSVYAEICRSRVPPRPPELLRTALETGLVDGLHCDFAALHRSLRTVFAAEELRFFDYADACAAPGGVLGTLLRHVAPDLTERDLTAGHGARANVSPRALALWAALAVAGCGAPDARLQASAETAFALEFGESTPTCIFTRAELARLERHFAPSNLEFARAVSRVQPGFAFGQHEPPPGTIHREDVGPDYFARLARRLWIGVAADHARAGA
ncbi:hypothetical protein K1T73_00155 [Roseovarius sp. SCSIO 43702]|uniref:hypothetical protein n=1 Tax=Roseovarius sp. SCSIO 43702 TaxID=2823043 RepID=UPI001C73A1AB|nr:hypothetical protein [Roseovarius sp. SCSIO 43702]QYX56870.1 hypothetical protein K1T73_00155 [Roseovarius sp. SCSIO 43702]